MADNFNLRQFLSENRLTKNAKLIKENSNWGITLNGKQVDVQSIEIDGIDPADRPDFVDAYIAYAEFEDGTPLTDEEMMRVQDENYGLINDLIYDRVDEGKQPESKLAQVIQQAWAEKDINKAKQLVIDLITPSRIKSKDVILATLKGINNKAKLDQYLAHSLLKFEKLGLNEQTPVKEAKLTTKERRLVEMVQAALSEEDVDYTMGHQNNPNQLPNPAPELNIPEGESNIEEAKPLPKYNSIEELMKEIEHGTNEAAHKYKMDEMKRVYEALEAKVGSLEEGENAEHIDQKKVKQMRKDIAALRKAEEKLRKEFDKKFSGKEKKETATKEKAAQALQEGFDLRKFLSENRK